MDFDNEWNEIGKFFPESGTEVLLYSLQTDSYELGYIISAEDEEGNFIVPYHSVIILKWKKEDFIPTHFKLLNKPQVMIEA